MKVAAVILNYNSANDTKKCIEYLLQQDYCQFEIVVVDNQSEVTDYEKLSKYISNMKDKEKLHLIRSKNNCGFSAGNNIGLRYAKKINAKWSWVINPDVEIRDKKYLSKMMNFIADKKNVAVAASNVFLPDGQRQNPMVEPGYLSELLWPLEIIKRKIGKNLSYLAEDRTGYCDKVSGCCFFINNDFLTKINYLDEKVFLYCEEPILASTVKKYGYKEIYYKDITAYHMHIDNEKGNKKKRLKNFRKSRRYYWKNYSDYKGIKLKLLLLSDKIFCFIKCRGE